MLSESAKARRRETERARWAAESPEGRERRLAKMRDWAEHQRRQQGVPVRGSAPSEPPPAPPKPAPTPPEPPAPPRRTVARQPAAVVSQRQWATRATREADPPATVQWQQQEAGIQRVLERALMEDTLGAGSPYYGLSLAEFRAEYVAAEDGRMKWRLPKDG